MEKKQLVLGLDLDGVVFNYEKATRERFAALLGVAPETLPRPKHWSLVESGWPLRDEAHFAELHTSCVRSGMFADMPLIEGASESLWKLSDAGVYIRIVTHRLGFPGNHAIAAGDTVRGLERRMVGADGEFGKRLIPYSDLTFVADKPAVGADVYLDDAPHNIVALRAAGRHAIVFDQPYNQHVPGPRAKNWAEVAELIEEYALEHDFAWQATPQAA